MEQIPPATYAALLGALVSAAIAFLGVTLTNRGQYARLVLQLSHEQGSKREELVRERIEEAYLLTERWLDSLTLQYVPYFSVMRGELSYNDALDIIIQRGKEQPVDFKRLQMLVDLYFPTLRPVFEDLLGARSVANKVVVEHKRDYEAGATTATRYIPHLDKAVERLNDEGERMRQAIMSLASEFLTEGQRA